MIKISFLGDISFNDYYNILYKKGVNPFKNISMALSESDFVIGNLEALSASDEGENLLKKTRLKTNLSTLNYLTYLNLKMVTLAHNHVYDNLTEGFLKTIDYLKKQNILFFGAGLSPEEARKAQIIKLNEISFCFLNYVSSDTNPNLPNDSKIYLNWLERDKVIEDIKNVRKNVDYVILLLHWGGEVENALYPHYNQRSMAKLLINEGADLIIGHHSHTLQPFEKIYGKYVFYSLGNFCFSNIYNDGKYHEIDWKKNAQSIIINMFFSKNSYSFELLPIKNMNRYIIKDSSVLNIYKSRLLWYNFIKTNKIFWYIYYLKYKYIDPIIFYFWGNERKFFNQLKKIRFRKILKFLLH